MTRYEYWELWSAVRLLDAGRITSAKLIIGKLMRDAKREHDDEDTLNSALDLAHQLKEMDDDRNR
jgi:hypothetical protein